MYSYQKTVYVGERVGDIDYAYDFRQHFNNYCVSDEYKQEMCDNRIRLLREIEEHNKSGEKILVWTGDFAHELISVGMYDGWPFWKPVPAMLIRGPLGSEWKFFYELTGYKLLSVKTPRES